MSYRVETKTVAEGNLYKDFSPLVSVLVPSFNHEKYILSCLESINLSDYRNIELIILDDGSSDRTYELAVKWIDCHQHRFVRNICVSQKNAGICKTFNRLASLSKGEYITIIASDDQLTPTGISEQLAYALKYDAGVVLSDCELINDENDVISRSAFDFYGKNKLKLKNQTILTLDVLLNWNTPYQHSFINREIFYKLGSFNEKYSFEDRDFCLRAVFNTNVVVCPQSTWRYRIRFGDKVVTPGLKESIILDDLHKMHKDNLKNAQGLNKFILNLMVINFDNRERFFVTKYFYRILFSFVKVIFNFTFTNRVQKFKKKQIRWFRKKLAI